MRYELKSVRIWAFTKVSFFINLPIGFMLGLMYAVTLPFMMVGMAEFGGLPSGAVNPSDMPIGVMLIILPIMGALFAAVFHTIFGVVLLAIYNMIVRMIGGLEFDLDPVKLASKAAPVRPIATQAMVPEAAVSVPPVSSTLSTGAVPPPPPAVIGVSETIPSTIAPTAPKGTTEIPIVPSTPPVEPTTTEIQCPTSALPVKPADVKLDNGPPSAPETKRKLSKIMNQSEIRVRIAPSPSGYVHVGTARTAIFNYLFARHYGGKFLVRIENTDAERSDPKFTEAILSALKWLGMKWDEDIIYQADRLGLYKEFVQKLVASGNGYPCFCTKEVLAADRERAREGKTNFKYNRRCLKLSADEVSRRQADGEPYTIRLRIPDGDCTFDDMVSGELKRSSDDIEDFIAARSDGSATYNLAVVVDDHAMRISHVIRGNDHITNTFKQIHLYRALGLDVPKFAHVPMILRTDKKKVSKSRGDKDVLAFRKEGILPEAMFNYLCLLGWSPKTDREIYPVDELIERFTPDNFNPSNSIFDEEKLVAFNQDYIAGKTDHELAELVAPLLVEADLTTKYWLETRWEYLRQVVGALKLRAKRVADFVELSEYFFKFEYEYDPDAAAKQFTKENGELLTALADRFERLGSFTQETIERCLSELADEKELKKGRLIHPTRLAVSGRSTGPSLYEMLAILSQPVVVERMRRVIEQIDLTNAD